MGPRACSTATSSRPPTPRRPSARDGGQAQVTEGLAVEAGLESNGYYMIYDAPDPGAAIAFAARIPVARLGGNVEVRPC